MGAEQVALAGHRGHVGQVGDQAPGGVEVVDDGHLEQQPGQRRAQRLGRLDDVDGVGGAVRQSGPGLVVDHGRAEHQAGAAEVLGLQVLDGAEGGVDVLDRDRVGRGAEGGGHRGLVARQHAEQRGDRPEQPGDRVVRGQQRPGAVLAVEPQLQRLLAGREAGALTLGGLRLLAGLGEPLLEVGERRGGTLVLGVEALLPRVEPGDPRLQGCEVPGGPLGAGDRLLAGGGQPADLLVGGGGPALQRVHLAVQPGQALAPVGGRAQQPGDPAVLLDVLLLDPLPGGDRLVEGGAVALDLGGDLPLLGTHPLRLGLELLGVAARGRGGLGAVPGVTDPLGGEPGRALEPLAQPGEREPGLLSGRQRGEVLPERGLEGRLGPAGLLDRGLHLGAALEQHGLVGELLLQRRTGGDQVVGEQPRPGVADVGLHHGGPAGDLGLAAEGLELAADLAEQVLQPGQVALGAVQLAERLLLALAVLEDTGGLLDEAATVLGRRVQDRVELALADDHVHLAADAGVGQQLLDVEQPARGAVDGVLRAAVAEHRAADRDLGVLDRQGAVGVVDGQRHLGPAQRRAAGGAGEDDVLHLAAAQGLRALLAHHPGERVDDVGLAGPVGADDAGDPRLELQGGRGGERLEPAERQALEVHGGGSPRSPVAAGPPGHRHSVVGC